MATILSARRKGRNRCIAPGCGTILNSHNQTAYCSMHYKISWKNNPNGHEAKVTTAQPKEECHVHRNS